jgi:hypothetical protein
MGPACTQIKKHIHEHFFPAPGLYSGSERLCAIGRGWRAYVGNGSITLGSDAVLLSGSVDSGFVFPDFDLAAPARFILFKIKRITQDSPVVLYAAFDGSAGVTYVRASTDTDVFGWGIPAKEFRVPLLNVVAGEWQTILIDTHALQSVLAPSASTTISFRFRAPIQLSHVACAGSLDEFPFNLRGDRDGNLIVIPHDYPRVDILIPQCPTRSPHILHVQGIVDDPLMRVALYVLATNGLWYRQSELKQDGRQWSAQCHVGSADSKAGTEYTLVAVASRNHGQNSESQSSLPAEGIQSKPVKVVRE